MTSWCIPAIACMLLGGSLSLAPAQAGARDIIWEGDDQAVLLAPRDDEGAVPNDHPVALAPAEIERMLASVRFRYADQDPGTSFAVFNAEQVEILGEALATGLASASPSQDVTFSVIGAHRPSPEATIRRNRVTAGRVFFRGQELNLIFGEIQSPYRKKNVYGRVEQDFSPRQFGSRTATEEKDSVLVLDQVAEAESGQATRTDWVTFRPGVAAGDEETGEMASGSAEPANPAAAAPAAPAAGAPPSSLTPDIEARLATLRDLRDKNLISEEAYRKKVDDILKDL